MGEAKMSEDAFSPVVQVEETPLTQFEFPSPYDGLMTHVPSPQLNVKMTVRGRGLTLLQITIRHRPSSAKK